MVNLSFLAGQNFFDGTASSVAGNVDALVTPVVKFSDRWSIFPTYQGTYQGTQDIQELAGGGTLFQDSVSQTLVVKSVHKLGEKWKIKPSLGGRVEWLRETRDEEWGEGLFDYRKASGGLEGEYNPSPDVGGRLAYDYYQLAFPNYESLESAQDPTLSRELTGKDVLNNSNHMGTFSLWSPLPARGRIDLTAVYNLRAYSDQPVVAPTGELTATDRKDSVMSLVGAAAFPIKSPRGARFTGQLGLGFGAQSSNQDHYDARKAVYVSDYYDYTEWRAAPRLTAGLAQGKWLLSLAGSYERREYGNRPAQDANGDFVGSKLWVSTLMAQFGVVRPVSERMRLRLETSLGWSQSNTDYEKVFQYNYRMANYLVGFSYEY